ncbi:MAG: hypothetical protein MUF49_20000 [Oculatellaceae cyanobacterium Prado106]|jgi:hypothetical protein|nr:hypothetical protein [Oculatellaceae cyanobacterium Prado106]
MTTNIQTENDSSSGMRDDNYDLVSVLYHALEGAATHDIYIEDAEESGDSELLEFFREIQEQDQYRVERARELLADRLNKSR